MMTRLLTESPISIPARQENKPKGLYFLSDSVFDNIYHPATRAQIAQRIDIADCPLTQPFYASADKTWPGVEIIFSGWGYTVMDGKFLARFTDLKIVFYGAGSIKPYVTEAFWQSGIRITHAAAANAIPVAEYTCAQIIQSLKGSWQKALYIRKEKKFPPFSHPAGAYKTTVGLLSLGAIGRIVAEWCHSRELKVVAYDPYVSAESAAKLNVTLLPLDEVFARSEVVSCHTPWLPETERMIRGCHFDSMKHQASFINTSRGAIIDEGEMVAALRRRPDLLAILDVTHPEPPVDGSPLYTLDNIILTPHIAGSMGHECNRMGQYMADELDRYLAGHSLLYEIDRKRAVIMA